jgi:hypothetical protein
MLARLIPAARVLDGCSTIVSQPKPAVAVPPLPRPAQASPLRPRTPKDENDLRISPGLGLSNDEMDLLEKVLTAWVAKGLRDTSASDLVANLFKEEARRLKIPPS